MERWRDKSYGRCEKAIQQEHHDLKHPDDTGYYFSEIIALLDGGDTCMGVSVISPDINVENDLPLRH